VQAEPGQGNIDFFRSKIEIASSPTLPAMTNLDFFNTLLMKNEN
jgi:hypothetical protein